MLRRLLTLSLTALLLSTGALAHVLPRDRPHGGFPLASAEGRTILPVEDVGLEARVEPYPADVTVERYPALAPNGSTLGEAAWRVVNGTGNCCENYITVTSTGRIVDLGGRTPRFSDDGGRTWSHALPPSEAQVKTAAEGAVAVAPDGDVVAMTWTPYGGDQVITWHHDAASAMWRTSVSPLHTPFYDRPWLAVVPGPFDTPAGEVPYLSIMKGGPNTLYHYSTDGLHYAPLDAPLATTYVAGGPVEALGTAAVAAADRVQPITQSGVTPLFGGASLDRQAENSIVPGQKALAGCAARLLEEDRSWSCADLPGDALAPGARLVQASDGGLYRGDVTVVIDGSLAVLVFELAVSRDGGRSWNATHAVLPSSLDVGSWDMKVHADAGTAVVGLHGHNRTRGMDQDMVLRFDVGPGTDPVFEERLLVGDGDLDPGDGLGLEEGPRFDFATVGILPDGRVVTSFVDGNHTRPHLAIELPDP